MFRFPWRRLTALTALTALSVMGTGCVPLGFGSNLPDVDGLRDVRQVSMDVWTEMHRAIEPRIVRQEGSFLGIPVTVSVDAQLERDRWDSEDWEVTFHEGGLEALDILLERTGSSAEEALDEAATELLQDGHELTYRVSPEEPQTVRRCVWELCDNVWDTPEGAPGGMVIRG
ncbi:hypothetical protein [Nitriliruptor alkaliphilus]|uniref:hypothetical protein n=1 Tax=Nitriliruptor alkaliphilus TaxID=427918 RepID=UPI000695A81C|nr:hypothetical protein [Nitriliruptor alkaliphilus]